MKSGQALRWDLGDGTVLDDNEVEHRYGQSGKKAVRVLSSDGSSRLTSLHFRAQGLTGTIPSGLGWLQNLVALNLADNGLTGYERGAFF